MKRSALAILLAAAQVSAQVSINAFNAGEVSPYMYRRYDFAKYNNAVSTCQNMLVRRQGPVERRPGTKYIAAVGDATAAVRLIPFEYSKTDSYVLEFGDAYMRVFRNGAQVTAAGSPYEIATDYAADELWDIQYAQNDDTMYLVNGSDPPQQLTRSGHASWTIADVSIETGPFLDENTTTTTITPSATSGSITLTASTSTFQSTQVGALWEIGHQDPDNEVNGSLNSNASSSALSVYGDYRAHFRGNFNALMELERSVDDGSTWQTVWAVRGLSLSLSNEAYTGTETEDGATYRVTMSDDNGGSCAYSLVNYAGLDYGVVRITGYTSGTSVSATVLSDLTSDTATEKWSEGAWSDYRGWPEVVEFYEQRLVMACTDSSPQTLWASKTAEGASDDYLNFAAGTDDDDAFSYILPGQNPVQWLLSQSYLLVGTLGGVGRWGDLDAPLTPSNPTMYRVQAREGADAIQAVLVGDAVLYVERGGRRVREYSYSLERDRYVAPDMTVLADHILGDGVVQIAYQSRPNTTLWCVLEDGSMATLTYERQHEVVAWSTIVTDGSFESVCVVPDASGGEDEVWVVVNRTIDGSTVRYVEQFQDRDWGSDQADCFFVDSGKTWDGGAAVAITNVTQADPAVVTVSSWPTDADGTSISDGAQVKISSIEGMTELNGNVYTVDDAVEGSLTFSLDNAGGSANIDSSGYTAYSTGGTAQWVEKNFSSLSHLEGEVLEVLADGEAMSDVTVASAAIEIDDYANVVQVGLPYTAAVETLPLVLAAGGGTTLGRRCRLVSLKLDFYETLGAKVGPSSDAAEAVRFYDAADYASTMDPVFTGWKNVRTLWGYRDDLTVYLTVDGPYPLTLRALVYEIEVTE